MFCSLCTKTPRLSEIYALINISLLLSGVHKSKRLNPMAALIRAMPKVSQRYIMEKAQNEEPFQFSRKILFMLNKNANARIIDISKDTGISAELIVYKLKKLKKEKVILTTRAYFDMEKRGYFYSRIMINLHNISTQNQNKLRQFSKNSANVDSLMFMIGKPNCYIQIFHRTVSDIHNLISNLNKTFPNDSLTIDILPLKNEGEDVNAIPFL
jgi:DNA-binding Lrp family transcriptional regulator